MYRIYIYIYILFCYYCCVVFVFVCLFLIYLLFHACHEPPTCPLSPRRQSHRTKAHYNGNHTEIPLMAKGRNIAKIHGQRPPVEKSKFLAFHAAAESPKTSSHTGTRSIIFHLGRAGVEAKLQRTPCISDILLFHCSCHICRARIAPCQR